MIGDFWSTAMDSIKLEQDGLKYLQPYLDKVNAVKDIPSMMALVSELKRIGSGTFLVILLPKMISTVMRWRMYSIREASDCRNGNIILKTTARPSTSGANTSHIGQLLHMIGMDSLRHPIR